MAWDQRYRRLNEGEIIQPGDEVEIDKPYGWKPATQVGQPAPDPAYTSHRVYRRLREGGGQCSMSEATVNTEEWALRLNKELTEARARIAALEAQLAERAGGVNEDALRALAQAYDREHSAQRGEPDPWYLDPGDIGDSDTWVSERLACARVAAEAFLSALEPAAPEGRQEAAAWPEPKVTNPDIANPTGVPYLDCLIHRLLDAQQDINLAANERMDQSLCEVSSLIDEVETCIRRFAATRELAARRWHGHLGDSFSQLNSNGESTMNINDLTMVSEKQFARSIPDDFVEVLSESYTFYFDDGRTYTPSPHERAMLVDFGHGLIAEYEAYLAAEHAEPAPAARSGEVKRLREALEKLLACPAIADENHHDAAWGCPDTAAAISFARAALEYADPEARDNWMTSDGDPLPEGEPIPEPVPYRKEPRMRLTDERGRSPWEGTDLEG